jgi:GT2 family glycosyltransferase
VLQLPSEIARCRGITGLALSERFIFAAVQAAEAESAEIHPSSALAIFDRRELKLRNHYFFHPAADVHSLWVEDGILYAVSTGTDELVALRLRGAEVASENCVWRPELDGPREDRHHLNAIGRWGSELLVCCFGKKATQRWNSARDGFIINITRNEVLISGIHHPHSLADLGGATAYCESKRKAVRIIGDNRTQYFPGYTRGLCVVGDKLFVASSMGRKVSRSTRTINNPAEDGLLGGQCTVSRLSLDRLEIEKCIDLSVQAQEIYDLLPVMGIESWPVVPEVVWRDTTIRGLAATLDQRTMWARTEMAKASHAQTRSRRQSAQLRKNKVLRREVAQLRKAVAAQTESLETLLTSVQALSRAASAAMERWAPEIHEKYTYCEQIARIRKLVGEVLPSGAIVLVVSKGDPDLLQLEGRVAWHFPQTAAGSYSGYKPADSTAAIANLEALRARGATHVLFPATAFWWLDHYRAFAQHLLRRYREIVRVEDTCVIFALREQAGAPGDTWLGRLQGAIAQVENQLDRSVSLLDWRTGLDLAGALPKQAVFSPPDSCPILPYLDRSVDVVAVSPSERTPLAEARRVASAAVVTVSHALNGNTRNSSIGFEWQRHLENITPSMTSIVIPCYNGITHTTACLAALRETLPDEFSGEVIVVDDASTDGTAALLERWAKEDARIRILQHPSNVGFILSCNRGAEFSNGEILVFLNNDTIPLPGWLPPLLQLFRDDPMTGAVGGKLLYPDGRLQEAGAVIFSDGSGANFGRGDYNPEAPLYDYVREVDYCSGALLATRRSLFIACGGFDTRYLPAYYEDTDYCFQVRQKGYRVRYQPESCVIHYEGATSGVDLALGIKQYQAKNRAKFVEKWQKLIQEQPSPPGRFDRSSWHALAVRDDPHGAPCP